MGLNLVRCTPADEIKKVVKKGHQIFGQEESSPRRENPGYAYDDKAKTDI